MLLEGPTGSGKELFAEAIHQGSGRAAKAFVAVNCSAFAKDLLESELFGYKKGAFTGAVADKKGLIEEANGGTLFLDEIGELELNLQAKLLRVLESQEFIKVGDTRPTRANVRLIAATNRNLRQEAAEGHFRADLYYRLSVFVVPVPPLSARRADVPELAGFYLQYFAAKLKRPPLVLAPEALAALQAYPWPGNVRELRNVLERAAILTPPGQPVEVAGLPLEVQLAAAPGPRQPGRRGRAQPAQRRAAAYPARIAGSGRQQGRGGAGAGHCPHHAVPQNSGVRVIGEVAPGGLTSPPDPLSRGEGAPAMRGGGER